MPVVLPPAFVGTRLVRVVAPVPSLLEVEEWAGEWWEPSSVTISEACAAESATKEQLDTAGVPKADRETVIDERITRAALSILFSMPAHLNGTNQMASLEQKPNGGRRRNDYAGSAKFKKRGPKGKRAGGDSTPAEQFQGPFRRASDQHQMQTDGTST
jgi:hypothetical protein